MMGGQRLGRHAMIAGAGGIDAGTKAGLVNSVPLTAEALVACRHPDDARRQSRSELGMTAPLQVP